MRETDLLRLEQCLRQKGVLYSSILRQEGALRTCVGKRAQTTYFQLIERLNVIDFAPVVRKKIC